MAADVKKKKQEEKIIPKEELKKYRDWYKPSPAEKILLSRILFEVSNLLASIRIQGNLRWSNEKKAFISIPYGEAAKLEVVADKTFSIPVSCVFNTDEKTVEVNTTIFGQKHSFSIKDMVVKHGFIDHEGRTFIPKFVDVECSAPSQNKKDPFKDIHFEKNGYQKKERSSNFDEGYMPYYNNPLYYGFECDCD